MNSSFTKNKLIKPLAKAILMLAAIAFCFAMAELYFTFGFIRSDGFNQTNSSKRWIKKYWSGNSFGYRDTDHDLVNLNKKKVVFVVGDSFAAGHGINDVKKRFVNRLRERLGPTWNLVMIAQLGWTTHDEILALDKYPASADLIILSYCLNDIAYASHQHSFNAPPFELEPPRHFRALINRSNFANFLYWLVFRMSHGDLWAKQWDYFQEAYGNAEIWKTHEEELLDFENVAKKKKARLLVIIFPQPGMLDWSRPIVAKLADFFVRNQIDYLDLTPIFENQPISRLVVNALDYHPSEWVHGRVANLIYEHLEKTNRLEGR
jgi:hypothetical protein